MIRRLARRTVAVALFLVAAPITAQAPLALDTGTRPPSLHVGAVLDDPALEDAVRSGLPLRMRFRVELWRDALFDQLVDQASWSLVVAFEPIERQFLAGTAGADSLSAYAGWADVRRRMEAVYRPQLRAPTAGRYYYIGMLEIETLSLSDLNELERWLRGELEPAVRGGRSVTGAVGTGLKRIFIRVLGLPARRYDVRSEPFTVP